MQDNNLASLPRDVQIRVANCLSHAEQTPLLQTCKSLCAATIEARRTRVVQQSARPGRFCRDPFPTLLEYVQSGGRAHPYAMHLPNILRTCAGLAPPPGGMLRQAAERRVRASANIDTEEQALHAWRKSMYRGERDKRGRPDGMGIAYGFDIGSANSVYMGEWRHGRRCGVGTQFFWEGTEHTSPLRGGWYEGQWHNDQFSGLGMLVSPSLTYQEGLWKHGQPVGAQTTQRARTLWGYLVPTRITSKLTGHLAESR